MAQNQMTGRGGVDLIDQFEELANILIASAGAYVWSGIEDEAASANIRRVRVIVGSLQGALSQIQMMPRLTVPPPPPPDDAMVTPAQQPARR